MKKFYNENGRHLKLMFLIFCFSLISPQKAISHEIPNVVVVKTFFKPQNNEANLLIRVPLEAMRDMNFPTFGPGYLDLEKTDQLILDAAEIWLGNFVDVYEDKKKIQDWKVAKARVAFPSDRSFNDYEMAYANIFSTPIKNSELIYFDQVLLDVLITYPIKTENANFSIDLNFGGLGLSTTTLMNFISSENESRVYEFRGSPGLVELDPSWLNAFSRFVISGVEHIFQGIDHLLFVLCLILPCRKFRSLIILITSFTVAHSITLIAASLGIVPSGLWFPPFIESVIALSIVYMAVENIIRSDFKSRWSIAFGFGLIHGFGFSFALSETMQFAGNHLLTSLLAFNIGVELGQILLVCIAVPLLNLIVNYLNNEKTIRIIISVLVGHTAWHWMLARFELFSAYQFTGLGNSSNNNGQIEWALLALIIITVYFVLLKLFKRISS